MILSDLTVEVRDPDLNRVGQLMPTDLVGAVFVSRYNNVGSWQVKLPNGSPMGELLRQPGYGIVVTGPTGVILSGPTIGAKLEQTTDNSVGDWVIDGADDSLLLEERLAYPEPSNADVATQTTDYDTRTGVAETIIKGYVEDNISLYAGTDRAIPYLDVETDLGRGFAVSAQARFDTLQELCYNLATTGGIGYTIEQNGDLLEFQVYEPQNLTGTIRMDLENGKLSKTDYSYTAPKLTRAIVGGSGEAVARVFYEGTTSASILAEGQWGRRIESFIDSRSSELLSELEQSANEALVENGLTIVNTSVTPSDDVNMRYGFDWGLGDLVTVVIRDIETSAIVTEVGISIEADGVRIGATVGTPAPIEFEAKIVSKVVEQDVRISNLERATVSNLTGIDTISTLDWAQFDTTYVGGSVFPGMLAWNDTDGTFEFRLKGNNVTLQIGQEQVQLVKSSTNAGLTEGKAVYLAGSDGFNITANYAQGNSEASSTTTFGIMTETSTGGNKAYCTTFGLVRNIDTSALTEGAIVWLSPTVAGELTTTKPTAPNHSVMMGLCVRSHATQGSIFVSVNNGYEIEELHNVAITTPANGDVLVYDSAAGLWKNKPVFSAPVTKTASFTVADTDFNLICQGSATITVTLPAAASWPGRELRLKTITAFTVVSASSNVVPLTSATAGTAILAATAGKWATLVSNGTNWVIMAGN